MMNKGTPRRLGMSRTGIRMTPTPQKKRTNESTNASQITSYSDGNAESAESSLDTPIKKQKCHLDCSNFPPKEQKTEKKSESNEAKTQTVEELKADIQQMNEQLEKYEKYKSEKKKLEQLIETWKAGGIEAVRQLQAEIQPTQEIESILEHFNLPINIFAIITD